MEVNIKEELIGSSLLGIGGGALSTAIMGIDYIHHLEHLIVSLVITLVSGTAAFFLGRGLRKLFPEKKKNEG